MAKGYDDRESHSDCISLLLMIPVDGRRDSLFSKVPSHLAADEDVSWRHDGRNMPPFYLETDPTQISRCLLKLIPKFEGL